MAWRIHLFLVLFSLSQFVRGTIAASSDGTSSQSGSCPEQGGPTRSIWGILESCILTLLICIWHTIHVDVPGFGSKEKLFFERVPWIFLTAFFAPEAVVSIAVKQWCEAHRQVKYSRVAGYEWSMSHSHFVQMGGFVCTNNSTGNGESQPETMTWREFLADCEQGKIANPFVTESEILALSKSDTLGKALFIIQLSWFTLQVIARGMEGLAVTLVELDTVCMSALALLYLFFWWDKPHRPQYPHIFHRIQEGEGIRVYSKRELSRAWKAGPGYLTGLLIRLGFVRKTRTDIDEEEDAEKPDQFKPSEPNKLTIMMEEMDPLQVQIRSLYLTWIILGGLHLVAWNWDFPSGTERMIWRIASLVLVTSPLAFAVIPWLDRFGGFSDFGTYTLVTAGIISRTLLLGLMLASLRALPCSAHQSVDWPSYIPHL